MTDWPDKIYILVEWLTVIANLTYIMNDW
jgi:hypothetical protein